MGLLSFIGYCLGLTEDTGREESSVLEREVVVRKKEHLPADPWAWLSYPVHAPFMMSLPDALEKNYITFEGESVALRIDSKELFDILNEGEKVTVFYRKISENVFDYVPPNFHSKKYLGQREVGQEFVGVQKKNDKD